MYSMPSFADKIPTRILSQYNIFITCFVVLLTITNSAQKIPIDNHSYQFKKTYYTQCIVPVIDDGDFKTGSI